MPVSERPRRKATVARTRKPGAAMARYSASVWREGRWFVAQCLEVDVASQGRTERSALRNLEEALQLYFTPPVATKAPRIRRLSVRRIAA